MIERLKTDEEMGRPDLMHIVMANSDFNKMAIHPQKQHFSSPFSKRIDRDDIEYGDQTVMVTVSTAENLPSPYSDCKNVNQDENEVLSFYAKDFEYTYSQCVLSCFQSHFTYRQEFFKSEYEKEHSTASTTERTSTTEATTDFYEEGLSMPWLPYYNDFVLYNFKGIPCNPLNMSSAFGFPLRCHETEPYGEIPLSKEVYSYWDHFTNETDRCYQLCPKPCFSSSYSFEASPHWKLPQQDEEYLGDHYFFVYFDKKVCKSKCRSS